jgi:hypothetical protein
MDVAYNPYHNVLADLLNMRAAQLLPARFRELNPHLVMILFLYKKSL